jgi:hypothetical protein
MTTLRKLHEELNITQRLSLYVKNQNKKYKPNERLEADTELSKTQETLIRLNTLGKQRMHAEQAKMLHDLTRKDVLLSKAIAERERLKVENEELKSKAKRAEKIVNNANMRDYIIKLFVVAEGFETDGVITEKAEELAKKYTKAAYQYLSNNVIAKILKDEANKLNEYLQMKEGE